MSGHWLRKDQHNRQSGERRCHAAIHILRIRQTAQGPGLPFGRFYAPCGLESQFVFAAALDQVPARKMQIAAEIVDFCESAIVACARLPRARPRPGWKCVVHPGDQAIGRGATEQSAAPVSVFAAHCEGLDVGFECLGAAPRVQLKIAHEHSEFECVVRLGRERQAARRKRYSLVMAEQDRLRLGRLEIGARGFGHRRRGPDARPAIPDRR